MARLLAVGRALVSQLDLDALLAEILTAARDITGARYAAVGVLDPDRTRLARFLTLGIDDRVRHAIGDPPEGRGVLGVLIHHPTALRVDDLSSHPDASGFPAEHPRMTSFLGLPILVRGHAWGNIYLTDKVGSPFDEEDELALTVLAEWASVAIENSGLHRRLTDRTSELERVTQALRTSSQIARSISGESELAPVLHTIAACARTLLGARAVTIALRGDDGLRAAARAGDHREGRGDLPADAHLALAGERCVRHGSGPVLAPLRFRGEALGVLAAWMPDAERTAVVDADLEEFLLSFSATAATAVTTARSAELERLRHAMEAADAERGRWARELHDETLQGLGGLRLLLTSALRSSQPGQLRLAVESAVEQLTTEADTLRLLITELRPAALDELGLEPAIESLVARLQAAEGLEVRTALDIGAEAGDLGAELETATYRVVQEALSNVAKHAGAERVSVVARRDGDRIVIEVADDGVGFDPSLPRDGFGVTGMRERIRLAGGTLRVETAPGEGTRLHAVMPIPPHLPAAHGDAAGAARTG